MKFICEGLDLSEGVLKVLKACSVKTTLPILECIKIKAENDGLILQATDGEISIQKKIKAEIMEEGQICVPGKCFSDFINKLTDSQISMETNEKGLEIKYGDSVSYIQILSADEFPIIDMNIKEENFVIKQNSFKKIIENTIFCCAQDDSRPILKGCLLEINDMTMEATALDGYRMAMSKTSIVSGTGNIHIICPARTLNEIARMLNDEDKNLTIYIQKGMMMVSVEDTVITSRLYQGEFINKNNILPTTFTTEVEVLKENIISSVERAAILNRGDKNNLVLFSIQPDSMRISSNSDIGNVNEKVLATMKGDELKIAMNSKYIADSIRALNDEKIKISLNSAISPFIVTGMENKDSVYLILPVRTTA